MHARLDVILSGAQDLLVAKHSQHSHILRRNPDAPRLGFIPAERLSRRSPVMPVPLRRVSAALAAVALCAPPLFAQRYAPATYAITNAKLVPVSSPVIPKGTIIIRDGLIAAIGANVAIPADARVVDGTGLTIYPGLFDSYGTIGLASAAPAGGVAAGRGGAAAPAAATGTGVGRAASGLTADDPRGVTPEVSAADQVRLDEEALDGPRSAGITTALTAPGAGVFQGQSALINLGGPTAAAMIVKPNVTQNISFGGGRGGGGGGFGGYPGSLMGVFAVLRQQLMDTQRYRELKAAYDKNPRSMARVEFDPSLEALLPVLARTQPVIMQANTEREIIRALDLAKEFNIRPIIAGGSEANLVADRLKAENVPVLLSVNFPRRTTAPQVDADPEPLRTLKDRVEYPKAAGRLATAGVKFAFESGGLTTWTDYLTNVQRAVDAGLSTDQAVRALTMTPAELFGVGDRMGSLEVGKIANLTVMKGDIGDKAARVSQLYVDGRPITVRPPTQGAGNAGGQRPAAAAGDPVPPSDYDPKVLR